MHLHAWPPHTSRGSARRRGSTFHNHTQRASALMKTRSHSIVMTALLIASAMLVVPSWVGEAAAIERPGVSATKRICNSGCCGCSGELSTPWAWDDEEEMYWASANGEH